MPQCQFPVFCNFCVLEKLHRKYSRNWTKRSPNLLFFPYIRRRPKESRRGARDPPDQGVACPPPDHARGWCGTPGRPLTPPLRLFKASRSPNPKSIGVFPRKVLQRHCRRRPISGDRSLCSSTLPGRGSAPGAIFIDSIDFTTVPIDIAVSHDEEGVVLPRG
jgi:hypothetical protein